MWAGERDAAVIMRPPTVSDHDVEKKWPKEATPRSVSLFLLSLAGNELFPVFSYSDGEQAISVVLGDRPTYELGGCVI